MDPKVPGKDSYSDDYEMDGLFAEVWFGLQVRTYSTLAIHVCFNTFFEFRIP